MESMVEKVGEELRKECLEVFGSTWSNDVAWRFARAAIRAMREPTEEQIDAGVEARGKLYEKMEKEGVDPRTVLVAYHPAGTIYAAMIDAALKETA